MQKKFLFHNLWITNLFYISVLSDATSSTEFLNTSLNRNSPPFTPKTDLIESTITSRGYQDSPYYPNSWGTTYHPSTYNNNCYNAPYNTQHYNTPAPVVYPAIISTVNQNQIHFHLHHTPSEGTRNEYFLPESLSSEASRQDLVPTTSSEIIPEHEVSSSLQETSREENTAQDPNHVWRPY